MAATLLWQFVQDGRPAWLGAAVLVAIVALVAEHRRRLRSLRSALATYPVAEVASPLPQVFDGARSLVADAALVRTMGAGHLPTRYASAEDRLLVIPAQALHDPRMVQPSRINLVTCAREAPVVDGATRVCDLGRLPRRSRPLAVRVGDLIVGKVTVADLRTAAQAATGAGGTDGPNAEQEVSRR